jgi:hypothetical protein
MGEVVNFNLKGRLRSSKGTLPLDSDDTEQLCLEVIAELVGICEERGLGSTRSHLVELVHKIRRDRGFGTVSNVQFFAQARPEIEVELVPGLYQD